MTDPTERHMAEALRAPFPGIANYCVSFTDERDGASCQQGRPCMCAVKRDAIAAALAQAERRGAEAQREADKMTISGLSLTPYGALRLQGNAKGWGKAIEAIVKAVDAAPLATATPEPEPPASRAARESAQPLALATKLRPDGSPDCGR